MRVQSEDGFKQASEQLRADVEASARASGIGAAVDDADDDDSEVIHRRKTSLALFMYPTRFPWGRDCMGYVNRTRGVFHRHVRRILGCRSMRCRAMIRRGATISRTAAALLEATSDARVVGSDAVSPGGRTSHHTRHCAGAVSSGLRLARRRPGN